MFTKSKDEKENLDILARRSTDKSGEFETRIGQATKISGNIEGKENLILDGDFDGKAKIQGIFMLGLNGKFKGELSAENAIIEGQFDGDVTSSKKIELRETAKFKGNISSHSIAIAEGSFFEGEIKMGEQGAGQQISFEEKRRIRTDKI